MSAVSPKAEVLVSAAMGLLGEGDDKTLIKAVVDDFVGALTDVAAQASFARIPDKRRIIKQLGALQIR